MFLEPQDKRYEQLVAELERRHAGKFDLNGRPWMEHYRRVAIRTAMLNPNACRDQLEAALFHDALFTGGGGVALMQALGLGSEAMRIVVASTPPPNKDYFRDLRNMTKEENQMYHDYIVRLCETNDINTIEFKLADISDTIDQLTYSNDLGIRRQLIDQYIPARDLLERRLGALLPR